MNKEQYNKEKIFVEKMVETRPNVSKVLDYLLEKYNIGSVYNELEGTLVIDTKTPMNEGRSQIDVTKAISYAKENIDECFCEVKY